MESINKQYFENVFFKALTTDNAVMSTTARYWNDKIFSNKAFGAVGNFYVKFFNENGKLPTIEELKLYIKDNAFASNLREAFTAVNGLDISKIDKAIFNREAELWLKEKLTNLFLNNVVDSLGKKPLDPTKMLEQIEKIASVKLLQDAGFNIYKDVERYIEDSKQNIQRLATGFADIDRNIGGGVPSDGKFLGVISAPTNMGKSIMLGNLAVNALRQNKKVLIISLEMSEMVYASRIYAALYEYNINELGLRGDQLRESVNAEKPGDMYIKEFPPASMTVEQIDGYIESLYTMGLSFDMICIDYLTLLSAPGADNSNEAGKTIARKLRALTYKYHIPLWTACQINREGMKSDEPDMSYIAESIAIPAESDLVLSLYRQTGDEALSTMRLSFLKSRLGPKGFSIRLFFNTPYLRFEDAPDGENNEPMNDEQTEIMNSLESLGISDS